MFDIILGLGFVILAFFAFWTVGCIMLKVMFKIADKIFGL